MIVIEVVCYESVCHLIVLGMKVYKLGICKMVFVHKYFWLAGALNEK